MPEASSYLTAKRHDRKTRAARSGFLLGGLLDGFPKWNVHRAAGDLVARFGAGYDTTRQQCRPAECEGKRGIAILGIVNADAS